MKIAIVGSAPSSAALAPYGDESWQIWACSPGAVRFARRVDLWFEMHRWAPDQAWLTPDYIAFMAALPCPVMMLAPVEMVPNSIPFPLEEILKDHHPLAKHFFSSTPAWMLAKAIRDCAGKPGEEHEIALFGIDMATPGEYDHQKPGCIYLIVEAQRRGIKVTVPPQSDLLNAPPMYGFGEVVPRNIKFGTKLAELNAKIADAEQAEKVAFANRRFAEGAKSMLEWVQRTSG